MGVDQRDVLRPQHASDRSCVLLRPEAGAPADAGDDELQWANPQDLRLWKPAAQYRKQLWNLCYQALRLVVLKVPSARMDHQKIRSSGLDRAVAREGAIEACPQRSSRMRVQAEAACK